MGLCCGVTRVCCSATRYTRDFPAHSRYNCAMLPPMMLPPGVDELDLRDGDASDAEAVPLTDWQREILAERLASHRGGQGSSRPWADVRQDLLVRLRAVRG